MVNAECTVSKNRGSRSSAEASKPSVYESTLAYVIGTRGSSVGSGVLSLEGRGVLRFRPAVRLSVDGRTVFRLVMRGVIAIRRSTLGTVFR